MVVDDHAVTHDQARIGKQGNEIRLIVPIILALLAIGLALFAISVALTDYVDHQEVNHHHSPPSCGCVTPSLSKEFDQ